MFKNRLVRIGFTVVALTMYSCSGPSAEKPSASTQGEPALTERPVEQSSTVTPKLVLVGALYEGQLSGQSLLWDIREHHDGGAVLPSRTLSEETVAARASVARAPDGSIYLTNTAQTNLGPTASLPLQIDVTLLAANADAGVKPADLPQPGQTVIMKRAAVFRQWQNNVADSPFAADFPDFVNGTPLQRAVSTLLSDEAKEFASRPPEGWGYRTTNVVCCSRNIVSVSSDETLSGGVHVINNTITHTYVVDGTGARAISLAELFVPGNEWQKTFSDLSVAELRRQFAGFKETSLAISDTLTSIDPKRISSFAVTPQGLALFIDGSAIGGRSTVSYPVTLRWNDLRPIIRADSPVEFLMQ